MNNFKENFYKTLIIRENFYMKQYYSNFHKREKFFAIKELKDGIYCVLISDQENEDIDYLEAVEYIKTLGKSFSLNIIILCNEEYIYTNYSPIANKLIISRENYNVISCDNSCRPLIEIFETVMQENKMRSSHTIEKFLKYRIPTLIIMSINIIIFIITQVVTYSITNNVRQSSEVISEEIINLIKNSVLISFGAKYNVLIEQGEVWRLVTSAFLHSNLIHIACNMYSLYIIGPEIQQAYGTKKYLTIYIISCITSTLLSYFLNPNSISVGASGGIFGLMGALLAFAIIERNKIQKKYISSLIQIIIINLFIGLSIKNIDNFGHIGGLIGGGLSGYVAFKVSNNERKKNNAKRRV